MLKSESWPTAIELNIKLKRTFPYQMNSISQSFVIFHSIQWWLNQMDEIEIKSRTLFPIFIIVLRWFSLFMKENIFFIALVIIDETAWLFCTCFSLKNSKGSTFPLVMTQWDDKFSIYAFTFVQCLKWMINDAQFLMALPTGCLAKHLSFAPVAMCVC